MKTRRTALLVAQTLGTTLLTIWLLRQLEWHQLGTLLRRANWLWIAAGCAALVISHLLNVVRWQTLVGSSEIGFARLLRYYGAGLFANNFLPTGIGGDGLRVLLLRQHVALSQAMLAVTLDRGMGIVALSATLAAGVWQGLPPGLALRGAALWPVLLQLFVAGVLGLIIGLVVWQRWTGLRQRVQPWLDRLAARLGLRERRWSAWWRTLVLGYSLSVLAHACLIFTTWAMLAALDLTVPGGAAIWLVLISSVSLLLPVTINGLGMVESIYVLVLRSYGVAAVQGVAIALLMRALMIGFSVLGGALSLQHRQPQPMQP